MLSHITGEQPLPCHDIPPMQTLPNSSAVLRLFPLRCCQWFPTLPVTLKQIIGQRNIETLQALSCYSSPKLPSFFYSVNFQKNKFWVIFNRLIMFFFFFFLFLWPHLSQLQSLSSQDKSKMLPRGSLSFPYLA